MGCAASARAAVAVDECRHSRASTRVNRDGAEEHPTSALQPAYPQVTLEGFGGLVQDTAWSGTGALLATSDKAKVAKVG